MVKFNIRPAELQTMIGKLGQFQNSMNKIYYYSIKSDKKLNIIYDHINAHVFPLLISIMFL